MKIAKDSKSWLLTPFTIGLVFIIFYYVFFRFELSIIFLLLAFLMFLKTVFFFVFFRDPERKTGTGFVAVADGKIREIQKIKDPDVGSCTMISTFMNVNNVHVNRMPIDGTIKDVVHIPGSHLPAFKKESEKNERVIITVETSIGMVKIIQIAGTIARRIFPYVKPGDKLEKGDRIGIIRFGSRVDVYLKTNKIKQIKIKLNDRIIAGESCLAEIND